MSILVKFSLVVVALLLLSAGALSWLGVHAQRDALQAEAIARGRTLARSLAAASAEAMAEGDPLTLVNLAVDAKNLNRGVLYAALVDRHGINVGHSSRKSLRRPFALEEVVPLPEIGPDVQQATVGLDWVWDLSADIVPKGSPTALGQVHIGISQGTVLGTIHRAVVRQLSLAVVLVLMGAGLSVFLMSLLVRPLRELAEAARKVGGGDFSVQVPVPSQDEVGQLIVDFNRMTANLETAQSERAEKERMQGELNVAHKIQANLLPDKAPDIAGWTLAFHCVPAKELGGDFYDWFLLDSGRRLGLVIADVSGKGVPAALHMANLRNLMRFAARAGQGPVATLKAVNEAAYPDLKGESFVTLCYVEIDLAARSGVMVSAGHDPALIVTGKEVVVQKAKGMPIGVAEPEDFDFVVKESRFRLEPGSCFVLYTDGVTEAMDAQGGQFGRKALEEAVSGAGGAKETLASILRAVKDHVGGHEQSDDLTALVLESLS